MTSNQNGLGYQTLSEVGEEGFFYTDGSNFCILVIRKGKVLIRLKVNKLTPKTDLEVVKKIGKEVIERI